MYPSTSYIVSLFKNKSLPSLGKITITARKTTSNFPVDLCFVQYIFEDGEQEVVVRAHGNATSRRAGNVGVKRTMHSAKDFIKEKLEKFPPRQVPHEIKKEVV